MPARQFNLLHQKRVMALPPGRHYDGDGLYLHVKDSGARAWTLIYQLDGKRKEMGLGVPLAASQGGGVTLAQARDLAAGAKRQAKAGVKPNFARPDKGAKAEQGAAGEVLTFGAFADQRYSELRRRWCDTQAQSWRNSLENWCAPIREVPLAAVSQEHVLQVVQTQWDTKRDIAASTQERLSAVLKTAIAMKLHPGPNPADWAVLKEILTHKEHVYGSSHDALPVDRASTFYQHLTTRGGVAPRCLQLVMLTAVRSTQATHARWGEFDLDAARWSIPLARVKNRASLAKMNFTHFTLPLAPQAVTLLRGLQRDRFGSMPVDRDAFVFLGGDGDGPLSNGAMDRVIDRAKLTHIVEGEEVRLPVTVHGMRSTFRDWAGDLMEEWHGQTRRAFSDEGCEFYIGHVYGDAARRAYRRGQGMAERVVIAQVWADYLCGGAATGRLAA